ncbi:MAG: amidohydrolase family protein [Vicinamibacterales bacterium]
MATPFRRPLHRFLSPLVALVAALAATGAVRQSGPATIAIRDVTVIPATGGLPAPHTTVLVRGDRIAAIGPSADTPVPPDARVVDGAGKYLVPGFIELHAHVSKARASSLGLFVANGVTTLRDMGGDHEELLRWRREIAQGTRLGPRMLVAGPYLEAARNVERMRRDPPEARIEPFERTRIPIGSPDEARRAVASLAGRELDFLKVRTVQDRETYRALIDAAHAHGLDLVGHVAGIPPEVVLEAGQDGIDHTFSPSLENMTRDERLAVWRRFAERGVPVVPTLVTLFETTFPPLKHLRALTDDREGLVDPRRMYVSRYLVLDWREQVQEASDERRAAWRKLWDEVIRRDLREMHQAGVDVLAGSDVAALNVFPGFSLHDEMALFVSELGMTPAEALERATSRSARFLGIGDSVGTVERGNVADLVLLDASPLDDIRNTRRIAAVILRGVLFDDERLASVLNDVASHPDREKDDWGRARPR